MSSNDIVISGLGARLPESRNVDEFCHNLFAVTDMVTNKDDRWPDGILVLSDEQTWLTIIFRHLQFT